MGLLGGLFKKDSITIYAPMKGRCVNVKEVSDPTFSEEILGKSVAILPEDGTVYAPADGTVTTVFPTGHAIALTTETGVEVLIHVGLDTVNLNGKHYEIIAQAGQKVHKGDILLRADLEKISADGYDIITPVIICNTDEWAEINCLTGIEAHPGAEIFHIKK